MKSIQNLFVELELAKQHQLIHLIDLPPAYPNFCALHVAIHTEPKIPMLLRYIQKNYPVHVLEQTKYSNSIMIKLSW